MSTQKIRKYLICMIGLTSLFLVPPSPTEARTPTQSETKFANQLSSILDIQIPEWERLASPGAGPRFKHDILTAFTAVVNFRKSNIQNMSVEIIYPLESGAQVINKRMDASLREYGKKVIIQGFEAVTLSPPPNQYEVHSDSLYINVANRYIVILSGEELTDPKILESTAKLIDLKKLAGLTYEALPN